MSDLIVYGTWAGMVTLGTLFMLYCWGTDKSHSTVHRNLGWINVFSFVYLLVIAILRFIRFDIEGWTYRFLFQLNSALLMVLTAAVYYIYKIPLLDEYRAGPSWKRNLNVGSNRRGIFDPENKVESDVERRLKREREARFMSIEAQEKEFIRSKEAQEPAGWRHRPSSDNVNRSGFRAYDFLEYVKYRRPQISRGLESSIELPPTSQIKEVIWWADGNLLKCHNTFRTAPGPDPIPQIERVPTLKNHPSAIFTNYVSVDSPKQITPAINLIMETLNHIPHYTTDEPSRNQFRYSVAVNCELFTFPPEFYYPKVRIPGIDSANKSYHPKNGYGISRDGKILLDDTEIKRPDGLLPVDEDRDLVSCMSVSVDKVLVVNFHILHMIQHVISDQELEQITKIFSDFILNLRVIKFWFNPQDDIKAMDATIDEMYRGTPRKEFLKREILQGGIPSMIKEYSPSYKLRITPTRAPIFSKERPQGITFGRDTRWGTTCPYGFHINAVDLSLRPCPCRTNNLDLAVVTEFIMRDIGLEPPRDRNPYGKRRWTEVRSSNYKDFEKCLLYGDKHEILFRALKDMCLPAVAPLYIFGDCTGRGCRMIGAGCVDDCPNKELWRKSLSDAKDRFYKGFSNPSFQQSHISLGYAVANAISIALIVRFLMTTQNPRLLLERLRLWSIMPQGQMDRVSFTREMDTSLALQRFDVSWSSTSKLIRTVPLYVENKAFAKEDLIEWVKDKELRQSVHFSRSKANFLKPERVLNHYLHILLLRLPRIFGEYVVENIVSKPQHDASSQEYRQSSRQFTIKEITEIFNTKNRSLMTSQLLEMAIAYFELKLIYEYEKDKERVDTMAMQFEVSRLAVGLRLGVLDKEVILKAKRALITPFPQPDWISRSGNLLQETLADVNKTAGGLFLKPTKPVVFPDVFHQGNKRMKSLLNNLLDLQELNVHRVEEFKRLMSTMVDRPKRLILENAALHGITHFQFPALELFFPPSERGMDTSDFISIDPMIQFWVLLVFKTTDGVRTRDESLTQRVFNLTYSPTNFYMPELHQVIKRATPTNRYERAQPDQHWTEVHNATDNANIEGAAAPPGVAPVVVVKEKWGVDGDIDPNLGGGQDFTKDIVPVEPEPAPVGPMIGADTWDIEDAPYLDSIRFDIDEEGLYLDPDIEQNEMSAEQAQFLRMLKQTIGTWCL